VERGKIKYRPEKQQQYYQRALTFLRKIIGNTKYAHKKNRSEICQTIKQNNVWKTTQKRKLLANGL